jgi:aminoglycoside phosphotransferase (APT) family kinase protein
LPTPAELLDLLQEATGRPVTYSQPPTPLPGGQSSELFAFRLNGAPSAFSHELVLRVPAAGSDAAREAVIQSSVSATGFPAPAVRLIGDGFMVMDRAPGTDSAEVDGPIDAIRVSRTIPPLLAATMVELHALDPEPVRRALEAGGIVDAEVVRPVVPPGIPDRARAWIESNRPPEGERVVCHGDLHALNVLTSGTRVTAVLDWELARLADPAFDVARTRVLLGAVPVEMSRAARRPAQMLGARMARRFQRRYEAERILPSATVRWYEAFHCARLVSMTREAAPSAMTIAVWMPVSRWLDRRLHHLTRS